MKTAAIALLFGLPLGAQTVPAGFFNQTFFTTSNTSIITTQGCRTWSVLNWSAIETSNGVYSFTGLDAYRAACNNTNIVVSLGATPSFHSSNPSDSQCSVTMGTGGCDVPSDIGSTDAAWKAFTGALAAHWAAADAAHAHYYTVWNEPNQDTTHPSGSVMYAGTIAQMVTLACDAHAAIHAADAQAVVLSPDPTFDARYIASSPVGVADWFAQFFAAGGNSCIDGVGFHYYPQVVVNGGGYYSTQSDPEMQIGWVSALRTTMTSYGVGTLPIYVTEGSWGNVNGLTTLQESGYLLKWHLLLFNAGVSKAWWYAADANTSPGGTCQRYWGSLIDQTNGICAQGTAYNWLLGLLAGASYRTGFNQPCAQAGDDTWSCLFTTAAGKRLQILWNSTFTGTRTVSIWAGYTVCENLDQTACTVSGNTVTLGANPIILATK